MDRFVLYSFSLSLPTIIAGLGFKSWKGSSLPVSVSQPQEYCAENLAPRTAQLMTVPVYAVATLTIGLAAWASARYNRRALFIIISAGVAIIGYILLIATNTCEFAPLSLLLLPSLCFLSSGQTIHWVFLRCCVSCHLPSFLRSVHLTCPLNSGIYSGNALLLSWPGENVSSQTKRAVAVAMQISIGDIGAIAGVCTLSVSHKAPRLTEASRSWCTAPRSTPTDFVRRILFLSDISCLGLLSLRTCGTLWRGRMSGVRRYSRAETGVTSMWMRRRRQGLDWEIER